VSSSIDEGDSEALIGEWIAKLDTRGVDEHGANWSQLNEIERERRIRILARDFESQAILLRLLLESEEADSADRRVWEDRLRLLEIRAAAESANRQYLHSAMDWTHDWDGDHGHDVQSVRAEFIRACRRLIEATDVFEQRSQSAWDLQNETRRRQKIKRWDLLPETFKQRYQDPTERTIEQLLANPFTPQEILERSLELFPFQADAWKRFTDYDGPSDNQGLPELSEWSHAVEDLIFEEFPDESEEADWDIEKVALLHGDHILFSLNNQAYLDEILENQRSWISIAYNRALPGKVLHALWKQLGWHLRELELKVVILMNANCPEELLTSEAAGVIANPDLELLGLVANPATPGNVLHQIALLGRDRTVNYFDGVGGTMDDVLMSVAVHPNILPETRALLALIGSEQVTTALQATSGA